MHIFHAIITQGPLKQVIWARFFGLYDPLSISAIAINKKEFLKSFSFVLGKKGMFIAGRKRFLSYLVFLKDRIGFIVDQIRVRSIATLAVADTLLNASIWRCS